MRPVTLLAALTLGFGLLPGQDPDAWDFVPGEKVLLYDDYTDMARGAAPPHWKVRGSAVRLLDGQLAFSPSSETTMWPNVVKWPSNFTLEMDFTYKTAPNDNDAMRVLVWTFLLGEDSWKMQTALSLMSENRCRVLLEIADPGENERQDCTLLPDKPNKFAMWIQDGRLRLYLNGNRLMDLNQISVKFDRVSLRASSDALPVFLGPVRIAESAPDFSQTILASGRYVTHGILFDVNSDRVKPESKPVLEQIAEALKAQSGLKLRIEGHTDSSGDPAKNLDLSKRRAASVKTALTAVGVAADRLTTEGFGDTKPVAKNDTPQGRAENRRVEFVRM